MQKTSLLKLFCTNIKEFELPYLETRLPGVMEASSFSRVPLSLETVRALPKDTQVLVVSHTCVASKNVISLLPELRAVITRSTGTDHIDVDYCNRNGIAVENIAEYATQSVAEYSVALLLVLLRNIHAHVVSKKHMRLSLHSGKELRGKRVGIVGFGRIGQTIARIVVGFGAHISFMNTKRAGTGLLRAEMAESFDDILQTCDVIFFCCPLTPETRHLIHTGNVSRLKRGVILVNTSRGGILQTDALRNGLREGRIGGVAIDVLEEETAVLSDSNHPLWKDFLSHPQVLYTPHNAFLSRESIERMWDTVLDLASFAQVQDLAHKDQKTLTTNGSK